MNAASFPPALAKVSTFGTKDEIYCGLYACGNMVATWWQHVALSDGLCSYVNDLDQHSSIKPYVC